MQYHNLLFTWSPYSNKTSEKRKPPESRERLQCLNLNWLYRTKPSPDLQVGSLPALIVPHTNTTHAQIAQP